MTGTYSTTVVWERGEERFTDRRYSRVHRWRFDGGADVAASASPHVVPVPMSDPSCVDPEEAFVASLSSCHMLFFLSIAASRGFVVNRYEDEAEGTLATDSEGRLAMTRVELRPRVSYEGARPDPDSERALHEQAHAACFIANSVRTVVVVAPVGDGEVPDRDAA